MTRQDGNGHLIREIKHAFVERQIIELERVYCKLTFEDIIKRVDVPVEKPKKMDVDKSQGDNSKGKDADNLPRGAKGRLDMQSLENILVELVSAIRGIC